MILEVAVDALMFSSVILALLGVVFFARYLCLDRKVRKEKSFLVVGIGVLAFWFFGGTGLLAIAFFLFCLFLLRVFF